MSLQLKKMQSMRLQPKRLRWEATMLKKTKTKKKKNNNNKNLLLLKQQKTGPLSPIRTRRLPD